MKKITLLLVMFLTITYSYSQYKYSVHAGAAVPLLNFASTDLYNDLAAGA